MSRPPKPPAVVLRRMSEACLGPVFEVTLDQIKTRPEDYRHRATADLNLKSPAMKSLMDSLIVSGLQEPLLLYRDEQGQYVLIAGHRRVTAIEALADQNSEGFSRSMQVPAREVLHGALHEYILLSVSDNVIRAQIDDFHLLKAACVLIQRGVDHTQIKAGLGLTDSTFDRCRRLADAPWMLEHVERDEVGLTTAHTLLEAAGAGGGPAALENLRKDLGREVSAVKATIATKAAEAAARDKELSGSDAVVKNYFPQHMVRAWQGALKRGERLPRHTRFKYGAALVQDKAGKKLVLPSLSVYLSDAELERLAEVVRALDRLIKDLKPELNVLARARAARQSYAADATDPAGGFAAIGLEAVDAVLPRAQEATTERRGHLPEQEQVRQVVSTLEGLEVADSMPADRDPDIEQSGSYTSKSPEQDQATVPPTQDLLEWLAEG